MVNMSCENPVNIMPKERQVLQCDINIDSGIMPNFGSAAMTIKMTSESGTDISIINHDPMRLYNPIDNSGRNTTCTDVFVLPKQKLNNESTYVSNVN